MNWFMMLQIILISRVNFHELVHDAPDNFDIESKFVEGAFSYNEYALNYATDPTDLVDLRS